MKKEAADNRTSLLILIRDSEKIGEIPYAWLGGWQDLVSMCKTLV